jgi:tetratricopeptide (TPR) repeat protein
MDRFDLGAHTRTISTSSPEAQRLFDLGLNWCFGFNKDEGVKCFQMALEYDPECVMAHWGVAYGSGPFYNLTWREHGAQEVDTCAKLAFEHIAKARSLSHRATELENQLLEALARRFQRPHSVQLETYDRWDDDYAAEMRRVYHNYPNDHDVMALFVEALITRTPRRLWNVKTGAPAKGSDIVEAVQVCERSMQQRTQSGMPQHPAIVHLHIHALEMSNAPQIAMVSADALATLCPDAGHLNHMPGHIYVLCGEYEKARVASQKAIRANDMYLNYAGPFTYYTVACSHDLHLMMHTCMLSGRYKGAIDAANKMCDLLTKEILSVKGRPKFATSLEAYYSMRTHVWVRFGRWQEIIAAPLPDDPELYLVTTAMHHYAKGVAHASLKNLRESERERRRFGDSLNQIPRTRRFFNNMAHDVLAVGEKMLDGELEYHRGNHELAYEHLRECVRRDDNLEYIEPWAWMHPPRHALAALLMEQGHNEEAEQIYRDDLGLSGNIQRCAQHPDNVWALHGLVECLQRRGETEELPNAQRKLAHALKMADVPITSSCMCRTKVATPSSCCATDHASNLQGTFPQ